MDLFKASNQWASRPADERFASLAEMQAATKAYAETAVTANVQAGTLRTEVLDNDVVLKGQYNVAQLTHWAFGQLSQRCGAPAEYLRSLPATLAVQNLNHGLKERQADNKALQLMMHKNGNLLLRSITGTGYSRFWNWEVAEKLQRLEDNGWKVPPARPALPDQPGTRKATAQDVLKGDAWGMSVREGDLIAPAGLYASDHDMFAFMVNTDKQIRVKGNPQPLFRGTFIENSEVGDSGFNVWVFLFEHVCGNHIVWNASKLHKISIRHVGHNRERMAEYMRVELRKYADSSASEDEAQIERLRTLEIGASKEEVLGLLFNKRLLSRALAERAYDACELQQNVLDGSNPRTPWGIAQGLSFISQQAQYADQRVEIDKSAGKVLEAF